MRYFAFLRPTIALAAVLCLACGPRVDAPPGDAALLSGTWAFSIEREGTESLHGTIALAPRLGFDSVVTDTGWVMEPRVGQLLGSFSFDTTGWIVNAQKSGAATGYIDIKGSGQLQLHVYGGCGDCGNLMFGFREVGDTIPGKWHQETISDDLPVWRGKIWRSGPKSPSTPQH